MTVGKTQVGKARFYQVSETIFKRDDYDILFAFLLTLHLLNKEPVGMIL